MKTRKKLTRRGRELRVAACREAPPREQGKKKRKKQESQRSEKRKKKERSQKQAMGGNWTERSKSCVVEGKGKGF